MDEHARQIDFMHVMNRFRRMHLADAFAGLSKGEFFTLEMLHKHRELHPEAAGMYVTSLANHTHMSMPAMSRLLKTLEQKGYIERTVDKEDRRNTYISMTAKGTKVRAGAVAQMQALTCRVIQKMGEEDMQQLFSLWHKLMDIMEAEIREIKAKGTKHVQDTEVPEGL